MKLRSGAVTAQHSKPGGVNARKGKVEKRNKVAPTHAAETQMPSLADTSPDVISHHDHGGASTRSTASPLQPHGGPVTSPNLTSNLRANLPSGSELSQAAAVGSVHQIDVMDTQLRAVNARPEETRKEIDEGMSLPKRMCIDRHDPAYQSALFVRDIEWNDNFVRKGSHVPKERRDRSGGTEGSSQQIASVSQSNTGGFNSASAGSIASPQSIPSLANRRQGQSNSMPASHFGHDGQAARMQPFFERSPSITPSLQPRFNHTMRTPSLPLGDAPGSHRGEPSLMHFRYPPPLISGSPQSLPGVVSPSSMMHFPYPPPPLGVVPPSLRGVISSSSAIGVQSTGVGFRQINTHADANPFGRQEYVHVRRDVDMGRTETPQPNTSHFATYPPCASSPVPSLLGDLFNNFDQLDDDFAELLAQAASASSNEVRLSSQPFTLNHSPLATVVAPPPNGVTVDEDSSSLEGLLRGLEAIEANAMPAAHGASHRESAARTSANSFVDDRHGMGLTQETQTQRMTIVKASSGEEKDGELPERNEPSTYANLIGTASTHTSSQHHSGQDHGRRTDGRCGNSSIMQPARTHPSHSANDPNTVLQQFSAVFALTPDVTGNEDRSALGHFFRELEADTNGWPSEKRARLLYRKLQGDARKIIDCTADDITSDYEGMKRALLSATERQHTMPIVAQHQLNVGVKPSPGETVKAYGLRVLETVKKANPPGTCQEVIESAAAAHFLYHLGDASIYAQLSLQRHNTTYHELINQAAMLKGIGAGIKQYSFDEKEDASYANSQAASCNTSRLVDDGNKNGVKRPETGIGELAGTVANHDQNSRTAEQNSKFRIIIGGIQMRTKDKRLIWPVVKEFLTTHFEDILGSSDFPTRVGRFSEDEGALTLVTMSTTFAINAIISRAIERGREKFLFRGEKCFVHRDRSRAERLAFLDHSSKASMSSAPAGRSGTGRQTQQ